MIIKNKEDLEHLTALKRLYLYKNKYKPQADQEKDEAVEELHRLERIEAEKRKQAFNDYMEKKHGK